MGIFCLKSENSNSITDENVVNEGRLLLDGQTQGSGEIDGNQFEVQISSQGCRK